GRGFGAERKRSQVTVGGGGAARYMFWSDSKIIFQLGPSARTGDIVVKAGGLTSNGLPFTVRRGRIFFVAANGNDRHAGSYGSPWKSITHAKDHMSPGDVTYIENGVTQNKEDAYNAYLSMDNDGGSNSGKPQAPKALVAYPNATVIIGAAH